MTKACDRNEETIIRCQTLSFFQLELEFPFDMPQTFEIGQNIKQRVSGIFHKALGKMRRKKSKLCGFFFFHF